MRGKFGRTATQLIEIFDKAGCDKNETDKTTAVIAYLKKFVFRNVDIGGKNNQCLQFALHAFYKDVEEASVATVLWNLVNWSKIQIQQYDVMITHLFLIECLVIIQLFL